MHLNISSILVFHSPCRSGAGSSIIQSEYPGHLHLWIAKSVIFFCLFVFLPFLVKNLIFGLNLDALKGQTTGLS